MARAAPPFDPFAAIVIWHGPDWRPDTDAPAFRHDHAELLDQCRRAVARREEAYPQLVATGKLAGDIAARDISGWQALLAEWQWIVSGEGELPCPSTLPARAAAIELALERVESELARNPRSEWNLFQRHLLLALAWHQQPGRDTPRLARLTRELREEAAARRTSVRPEEGPSLSRSRLEGPSPASTTTPEERKPANG